ncbi:hypothetical protein FO441_08555 [Salinicoccus cyprini]|uniref:Uncharacterized protein n=1 Tax=Salinicoccus cyprini TaxID=2493691 RepID=A0A558AU13_9STAP|nr:hypothetical protein [Salinicoccus cyprini]TVT27748.1 hypothetical protein FO441_08555 [Salinicoccus cyprini]
MKRIKFYPVNDLLCGYNLNNSEQVLKPYANGEEISDINVAIEIFNIKKYFDAEIFLSKWSSEKVECLKAQVQEAFGQVAKFIKLITQDNLAFLYESLEKQYEDDFWYLINKFKVYKNINDEYFRSFLNHSGIKLLHLLRNRDITRYYGNIIKEFMVKKDSTAVLLLKHYELEDEGQNKQLHLPDQLSNEDKEEILVKYIDNENANLNYLKLIANIQSNKNEIEINPKTRLKAKRKVQIIEENFFQEKPSMAIKMSVSFLNFSDKEIFNSVVEDGSMSIAYNRKWILENDDYATILNNFIYLFEYVDTQMRIMLVNSEETMSVFERLVHSNSKKAYKKGLGFEQINAISSMQLSGYYNLLLSENIRLEDVVEWFFKDYLSSEFNIKNFQITMPSENSTILEKCTNIMPTLESVLKQFTLLVKDGEIDFELLDIQSEQLMYKNIPSLVENKYVYGIGEEFEQVTFLLFSDQSLLSYHKKQKREYDSYSDLMSYENFKRDDYSDYELTAIDWLIEHGYLEVDQEEYINMKNSLLINILKNLYYKKVISYWKYNLENRKIIDELCKRDIVKFESSLLTKPEQDYINYFLNKSQFNNGFDLRNKYIHTQPYSMQSEKIHHQNYTIFLKIFILIVIKINDDFCIFEELQQQNS